MSTGQLRAGRIWRWLGEAGLIVAACWTLGSAARAADEARVFRAGAHAEDITPRRFPISMNGQMRNQVAREAHDRLHARCLVLDDGRAPVAFVVVDSCLIPRPIHDEAKARIARATAIRAERILISATHTHTAPAVGGVFQTEPDSEYAAFLVDRIVAGVEHAFQNREPARVGWGVGHDPTQVFCRDWFMKPGKALTNPFGGTTDDQVQMHPGYLNPNAVKPTSPVDSDVSMLAVQARDGRPIALLANFSMHYAGWGIPPGTASADYFGRFAERIKTLVGARDTGPPFVGIMSNGTSGNLHCYDYSQPKKPLTIDTVADSVAQAAFVAYQKIAFHDWVPLVVRETTLKLGLRLPAPDEVAHAKEVLAAAEGRPLKNLGEFYARETVLLSQGPAKAELKLQAMRIGQLGIAAIPCEVFAETGLAIKQESPLKPTFTIELANGYNGYLPPPSRHKLGGYETWRARSSCLETEAEPRVRAAVLKLLNDVATAAE